jgi:hypothetical protein
MVCSDGLYNERNHTLPKTNGVVINQDLAMLRAPALRVLPETSSEEERTIVMGLMRAAQLTIAPLIEKEADIYTAADLKVRFR